MNEIFTNIQMQLKEELDEKRYEHTIGVHVYGSQPCHALWRYDASGNFSRIVA